jgi:hypothetical protein
MRIARFTFFLLSVFLYFLPSTGLADRYRYMDSAGTIRWADSLYEVPTQYRDQVQPETPVPDERTYKWMLQQQKKKDAEKKKKEAEEKRKKITEEKKLKAEERKKELEEKKKAQRKKKQQANKKESVDKTEVSE